MPMLSNHRPCPASCPRRRHGSSRAGTPSRPTPTRRTRRPRSTCSTDDRLARIPRNPYVAGPWTVGTTGDVMAERPRLRRAFARRAVLRRGACAWSAPRSHLHPRPFAPGGDGRRRVRAGHGGLGLGRALGDRPGDRAPLRGGHGERRATWSSAAWLIIAIGARAGRRRGRAAHVRPASPSGASWPPCGPTSSTAYQAQPLSWHQRAPAPATLVAHAGVDAEAATEVLAPLPYSIGRGAS